MNYKKKSLFYIVIAVVILALFIWGLFYLRGEKSKEEVTYNGPDWSPASSFLIQEEDDYTLVKNEDVGLEMKVPQSWEVVVEEEKDLEEKIGMLIMKTPGASLEEDLSISKGCYVRLGIYEDQTEADAVRGDINYLQENPSQKKEKEEWMGEVINIKGEKKALKDVVSSPKYILLRTRIPAENRIIKIRGRFAQENLEECKTIFEKLLQTINL